MNILSPSVTAGACNVKIWVISIWCHGSVCTSPLKLCCNTVTKQPISVNVCQLKVITFCFVLFWGLFFWFKRSTSSKTKKHKTKNKKTKPARLSGLNWLDSTFPWECLRGCHRGVNMEKKRAPVSWKGCWPTVQSFQTIHAHFRFCCSFPPMGLKWVATLRSSELFLFHSLTIMKMRAKKNGGGWPSSSQSHSGQCPTWIRFLGYVSLVSQLEHQHHCAYSSSRLFMTSSVGSRLWVDLNHIPVDLKKRYHAMQPLPGVLLTFLTSQECFNGPWCGSNKQIEKTLSKMCTPLDDSLYNSDSLRSVLLGSVS